MANMTYKEYRERKYKELNDFPFIVVIAFSDADFQRGLNKYGVRADELYSVGGGMFVRKTDRERLDALFAKYDAELAELIKDNKFLKNALFYELGNYEYGYTYDESEALQALGLTEDKLAGDAKLAKRVRKIIKQYEKKCA